MRTRSVRNSRRERQREARASIYINEQLIKLLIGLQVIHKVYVLNDTFKSKTPKRGSTMLYLIIITHLNIPQRSSVPNF